MSLDPCLLKCDNNIDFTYASDVSGSLSILDHFIVSENIIPYVSDYFCTHDGDNLSDHSPVYLKLKIDTKHLSGNNKIFEGRPKWDAADKGSLEMYRNCLSVLLCDINIPMEAINCVNMNCKEHIESINQYHNDIIDACLRAAIECIPVKNKYKRVAGWSEFVQPFKEKSIFWSKVWAENGCPSSGILWEIMRKAKQDYKRKSRWILRKQDEVVADRMATSILQSGRDFWKEVRKKE